MTRVHRGSHRPPRHEITSVPPWPEPFSAVTSRAEQPIVGACNAPLLSRTPRSSLPTSGVVCRIDERNGAEDAGTPIGSRVHPERCTDSMPRPLAVGSGAGSHCRSGRSRGYVRSGSASRVDHTAADKRLAVTSMTLLVRPLPTRNWSSLSNHQSRSRAITRLWHEPYLRLMPRLRPAVGPSHRRG